MKYNGIELEEMTPDKWDGRSRKMLVWDDISEIPLEGTVLGHFPQDNIWIALVPSVGSECGWQHCAEMPTEVPVLGKNYRRKKFRRMTNRELSDLMATGKVEKCYPYNVNGRDYTKVYRTHSYYRNREDSPCAKSILIRYEGTNEWVKPLIEE